MPKLFWGNYLMTNKQTYTRAELVAKISPNEFMCSLCRHTQGHLGKFRHAEDCPLNDPDVIHVELTAVIDPARVCTKCYGQGKVRWTIQDESEIIDCDLCGGTGRRVSEVELSFRENRWWWLSERSGKKYHIEELPNRFDLLDEAGRRCTWAETMTRLCLWIKMNEEAL